MPRARARSQQQHAAACDSTPQHAQHATTRSEAADDASRHRGRLQVVLPSFFGSEVSEIEKGLDDFYLVVLRWDAAHGGHEGAPPLEQQE